MKTALAALLIALAPAAAFAQAGQPVTSRCAEGKCDQFQVMERQVVGVGPLGKLVMARTRSWTNEAGTRLDPSEDTGYAFCSRESPALVSGNDSGATAILLAPLAPAEYTENPNYYAMYFEVCHDAGADMVDMRDEGAINLGYATERPRSSTVKLARPADIVALASQGGRRQAYRPTPGPTLSERYEADRYQGQRPQAPRFYR